MDATTLSSLPRLTIDLQVADTPDRYCAEYIGWMYPMFTKSMGARVPGVSAYGTGTSVALLADTYDEWFQAVGYGSRRKVRRAERLGYTFQQIERDEFLDDIYAVNTSMAQRQGRDMDAAYQKRPGPYGELPSQPCPRHRLVTYGVLLDGTLVAYAWVYMVGEMVLLSTLLGHGDHLENGVMYLLIAGVVGDLIGSAGAKYAVYERHWSGTDGLRFFKEQMGFRPYLVTWRRGDEQPPTARDRVVGAVSPYVARGKAAAARTRRRARRLAGRVKRRALASVRRGKASS